MWHDSRAPICAGLRSRSLQDVTQFLGHGLHQLRPAVELSGGVLEDSDLPPAVRHGRDKDLNGVEFRPYVRLPGRYEARDRPQRRRAGGEQPHTLDLRHVGRRLVIGEDPLYVGGDAHPSGVSASVESDGLPIRCERRGELLAARVVPALQYLVVQPADHLFVGGGQDPVQVLLVDAVPARGG
jgi:hypothetical protein